jgi:hypothetical protein
MTDNHVRVLLQLNVKVKNARSFTFTHHMQLHEVVFSMPIFTLFVAIHTLT